MEIDKSNIDDLYKKVKAGIEKFTSSNVSPESLLQYLKKDSYGYNKFIKENDLEQYEKIHKIIVDVISDLIALEQMKIHTFESFNFTPKSNFDSEHSLEKEKILADLYKVSLGRIEKTSTPSRYIVNGLFKRKKIAYIYTEDEKADFVNALKTDIYNKVNRENFVFAPMSKTISLYGLIEKETFFQRLKINNNDIVNYISFKENALMELIEIEGFSVYATKN